MAGADATITPTLTGDLVDARLQNDVDRSARFTFGSPRIEYGWGDIRGHGGGSLGELEVAGVPVKVHGPEVGFNRQLGGGIAIVKYADNYHALEAGRSAWVKPGTRWTQWQAFVDRQLAALDRPYVIAGFIWLQGIDDGILGRDKAAYKADLLQIAADLRAKFGPAPFILGRSINSDIAGQASMAPIREAQVEVGALPGNAWVNLDDLGPYVAVHHLTSAGQLQSGKRFAEAFTKR